MYSGKFSNKEFNLTIEISQLSGCEVGGGRNPELLELTVNGIKRQSVKLRHYHYDTWTFLPNSRDDAVKKGLEAFLLLPLLLLVFTRDKQGTIDALEWDLQAGVCGGPAPGIDRIVSPIRFHKA